MKGSKAVIQVLNATLKKELTSINRYFLHARMQGNWGLEKLNAANYKKSIQDMKQADLLIERILLLEGLPNLQQLGHLNIGETPEESISCDVLFQTEQLLELKQAISVCELEQDYISRDILTGILEYEETHLDWLETQEHLIENMGLANYLQSQV